MGKRRRLQLSNLELASMTAWPPSLIEDYLSINDTLNFLVPEAVHTLAEMTTRGFQFIVADNAIAFSINLNPNPIDGERVAVKNIGAGTVTMIGSIDAAANDPLVSLAAGNYTFFSSLGYWVKF